MDKTQQKTTQAPEQERYEAPAISDIEPVSIVTGNETPSDPDEINNL